MIQPQSERERWRMALGKLIEAERCLQRAEDAREVALCAFLEFQPPLPSEDR